MPRNKKTMTDQQKALAKQLAAAGYSLSDISERIGFSASAVANVIK